MKKIAKKLALYIGLSIGVVIIGGVTWTGTMFYGLDSPKPAVSRNMVEETLRPTVHGAIKGIATTTGMHMWFGIPYAGPVSGENRWTMPSAPEAWSTPKDLTANPEDCYQFGKPFDELPPAGHIGVEDCLTLDVMAPAFKTDEIPTGKDRLPVIVWIHGGGNAIGYPGDLTHNKLVPEENVVVVAPRYRLGPFGWFSHAAVRETGVQTANFGLEDLIYSLRWVQENIAEFGGDPENITLVGESAGGVNIFSLILSPRAKGLFHKTIMQSGVSFTTTRSSAENRETDTIPGRLNNSADIVAKLLVLQGKATDEEAAHKLAVTMPPSEIISFLKTMPALSLIRTYQTNPTEKMFPIPAVIRDGFTIPDVEPEVLLADRSTYNAVPGILGTNRDEMKMGQLFNSELVGKNLIGLPFMKDQERYVSASRYKANIWKYVGADKPASLMVGSGQKDIFVFRFDWDEQPTYLGRDLGAFIGASHTMEIPFIFGQFQNREIPKYFLTKENAMGRESLSRTMRGYWAEFARTGKPGRGSGNAPNWKPWNLNAGEAATLLLDTPEGGDVRMAPARVNFAELQAELIADETHAPNEKCSILSLLTLTGAWTVQDLNAATGGTC